MTALKKSLWAGWVCAMFWSCTATLGYPQSSPTSAIKNLSEETDVATLFGAFVREAARDNTGPAQENETLTAILGRLDQLEPETTTYLLSELRQNTNITNTSRILHYFRHTGKATPEVLATLHEVIPARLDDRTNAFLSAALLYIAKYGTEKELPLLRTLEEIPNPVIAARATTNAKNLSVRLRISTPQLPQTTQPRELPSPPAPKETPTPSAALPAPEKPNTLLYVLVGLLVVVIAVVVLRKARKH